MEELLRMLNAIYPLPDNLKEYLAKNGKTKNLSKKELLLQKGQINREIFFVTKGLLRCFYTDVKKEFTSRFMLENDMVVSMESFFNQTESYESIQALEDCILVYITYHELQFIFRNFVEFNFIARVITERCYTLNEQRLHVMRIQNAPGRYAWLLQFPELILRVPTEFLASYLDITEVTLRNIKGNL